MTLSISFLIAVLAGGLQPGEPVSIEGMQGLGETRRHVIQSELQGRSYDILVGLPADYDAQSERRYPVLYLLDGGNLYPMLRAYYQYLRSGDEVPDMIVVAISYGSNAYDSGNERGHDYTAPSDERDYYGGAADFQAFLQAELLPDLEKRYRARSDRRMLFGHSLGGQFVLFTAQTRPDLFWGHIASNPALHRNLPFFLQTRANQAQAGNRSRLFVGNASNDSEQFRGAALEWIEHWSDAADKPWELRVETLPGHSHMSAPPAAFRRGLLWLFSSGP